MTYKIMSTVKAHLDENNNIISPTQTILQDGILQTSNLMPKNIRNKIIDANVVVDVNSLRSGNVCRGDIYIDTKEKLSLLEQRQMIDAMSAISSYTKEPIMSPVVIRNSPDTMPEPALIDDNYIIGRSDSEYVETESAFIGAHVSTVFLNDESAKDTYRNADTIAKTLNKELNQLGLRTVFADMSVCRQDETLNELKNQKANYIERNCYMVLQKTSRFKDESFNNDKLMDAINLGFKSDKLNAGAVTGINIIPVANTKGLIGSISLENVQMSGQRAYDVLSVSNDSFDSSLAILSMENNPLFVNGVSSVGEKAINYELPDYDESNGKVKSKIPKALFNSSIPGYDSSHGYSTSTPQNLSNKWNFSNAMSVNILCDKNTESILYENIKDIVYGMNEAGGYSENEPFITGISAGTNISSGDVFAQTLFISYNPDVVGEKIDSAKKEAVENFIDILSEYNDLKDMSVSTNSIKPLLADVYSANSILPVTNVPKLQTSRNINETLNSEMLAINFEDRENQMSL